MATTIEVIVGCQRVARSVQKNTLLGSPLVTNKPNLTVRGGLVEGGARDGALVDVGAPRQQPLHRLAAAVPRRKVQGGGAWSWVGS